MLPKRIARLADAAVVCIDHVTKASESRGRYAIGGQHKLAGTTGAAYKFTMVQPLYRPVGAEPVLGVVDITVIKDRPAFLRSHTLNDQAGSLHFEACADGSLTAQFVPPGESGPAAQLVTEILDFVAVYDGVSFRRIDDEVDGRSERIRQALKWMLSAERQWLQVEKSGRSHLHSITTAGRNELAERKPNARDT